MEKEDIEFIKDIDEFLIGGFYVEVLSEKYDAKNTCRRCLGAFPRFLGKTMSFSEKQDTQSGHLLSSFILIRRGGLSPSSIFVTLLSIFNVRDCS